MGVAYREPNGTSQKLVKGFSSEPLSRQPFILSSIEGMGVTPGTWLVKVYLPYSRPSKGNVILILIISTLQLNNGYGTTTAILISDHWPMSSALFESVVLHRIYQHGRSPRVGTSHGRHWHCKYMLFPSIKCISTTVWYWLVTLAHSCLRVCQEAINCAPQVGTDYICAI